MAEKDILEEAKRILSDTDESETINGAYLSILASDEWGIYKTFSLNIANIQAALGRYSLEAKDQEMVRKRLDDLQARFESVPKTMRWKLRARVGEKVKCYELPEQDQKVVD